MTSLDLFFSKVNKTESCWLWTGGTISTGYGTFNAAQFGIKAKLAHRWIYEQTVAPVPRELVMDHLCNVRKCVNPAHLKPVTQRENILRGNGAAAQTFRRTHCDHGHEYTIENTRISPSGWRICRACKRVRSKHDYFKNIERSRASARIRAQRHRDKIQCESVTSV